MKNKLTYKIGNILIENGYREIIVKDKRSIEESEIQYACIKFKYKAKKDEGYLTFGTSKQNTLFEIAEDTIEEVIIDNDSITIETEDKTYYCYQEIQIIP
ncbi:hypothetical protein [Faecalimicrobium dakarense]|uniref:hypothetical protein n=1 Tax=Faecalimicrobium dakarense TaxID=1301100 RepID=UPI0004B71DA4|nr:hypothetical protein [[Clostridium] dakarense]